MLLFRYFEEVISKMSGGEITDVELLPDGSWKSISPKSTKKDKKDKDECSPPTKVRGYLKLLVCQPELNLFPIFL